MTVDLSRLQLAADIRGRHIAGMRWLGFRRTPFKVFKLLYYADLADGEPRSAAWLIEQLGLHGGKPRRSVTIAWHIAYLRDGLQGTRFGIVGDRKAGYRLAVRLSPAPDPAALFRRARAHAAL